MSKVIDSICWNGVNAQILIYAAWPSGISPKRLDFNSRDGLGSAVFNPFCLQDEQHVVKNYSLALYELSLEQIPDAFEEHLRIYLEVGIQSGASIVWMMFEGMFEFGDILGPSWADSVYGIHSTWIEKPMIALDDFEISSEQWKALISAHREFILS